MCSNDNKRQHGLLKDIRIFPHTCHGNVPSHTESHKHHRSTMKTIKSRIIGALVQTSPNLYDCLSCLWSPTVPNGYRRGNSRSVPIGPLPPPHFLLDLTPRHLPDSNYHGVGCSSNSSGPAQQHLIPAMNHTANCSITSTIKHLK